MILHPYVARTALLLVAVLASAANAAGTAAGTDIANTATATYTDPGGTPVVVTSNTETVTVDEVLDVTAVANDAGNVAVITPSTDEVLSFTVTNTGNGPESFGLSTNATLAGDQFNPANVRIYLDDGDNVFDPLTDTLYVAGSNDPSLTASGLPTDAQLLFLVSDIPGSLINGNVGLVRLTAEALTARATPGPDLAGTVFSGAGEAGTDAVVGSSTAEVSVQNGFVVQQVAATFVKSFAVADGFGGSNALPGAIITYTLTFDATGTGALTNMKFVDVIPANTTYQAGTLKLDGSLLTDIADEDEGFYNGTQVEVVPNGGAVTAPATHVVTFDVKVD